MELYVGHLKIRYIQASRKEKKLILDEFCQTSGYDRKYVIKLFKKSVKLQKQSSKNKRGRKKTYNPGLVLAPLKEIWFATDQMCGRRLKSAIPLWLPFYESSGALNESVKQQLLTMSSATIDRLLKPSRIKFPKRMCGTKPGSLLKKHIPVKTDQWDTHIPGFFEADTVAHCGQSLMGDFVWSLTFTDIATTWTENRAVWGKGARDVLEKIEDIEAHLPFPILGFDSDNGSEFLNYHLVHYFQKRDTPVQFTRSRPYHSDDNAHVEQKNWTHVRQLFGYYRMDNKAAIELMNDLYRNECTLLRNYFHPTIKLRDKERVNAKIIKRFEKAPKTPYQRVMESEHINQETKDKLTSIQKTLNPFELKKSLEIKLKRIFAQVDLHLKGRNVAI
jgi:hypothetical protein